jgi:hypothetical protein
MLWSYLRSVDFCRMKKVAKSGRGTVYRDVTIEGELGPKLDRALEMARHATTRVEKQRPTRPGYRS